MHQIRFRLGLCPRPRWGAYSAPPDRLAGFKGAKGGEGKGEEGRGRRGGEGKEEKGKERREGEGGEREGGSPPVADSSGSAPEGMCATLCT